MRRYIARRPTVALELGVLTSSLLDRYCNGWGCEIGPGGHPYTTARSSILVDKFMPRDNPFGTPVRLDLLADAAALPLRSGGLEYVFSSHCAEHYWDTIAVLLEWARVVRPGGFVLLVLPHKERTFDVGRPASTVDHHLADFEKVGALDETHWREWESVLDALRRGEVSAGGDASWLHQVARGDGTYDRPWIAERGLIHYHAWTQSEMAALLSLLGLRLHTVIEEMKDRADSFLVVAERPQTWSSERVAAALRKRRAGARED